MGVIACANAVFAVALSRFLPVLLVLAVGAGCYFLTMRRFIAQMRDQPRARWITKLLDEPLFAHFGASVFALLTSPLCLVLALALATVRGSSAAGLWRASEGYAYALGLGLSIWAVWVERRWVRVRQIEVAIANLPPEFEGYRIAQLSDLHVGSFDPKARALEWVALSNAQAPDLAVVTGDLVTSGTGFYADVADAIAALCAKDGVFVSMGNHDQSNNDELTRCVSERGSTVLRNAWHTLRRGNAELTLAGLDGRVMPGDVARVLSSCPSGAPIVFLSHYPSAFEAAAAAGADLVLAGHSHGGQLGVPFLSQRLNLARLTGQRSRGLVYSGKTALYVNAGLGTTGPPMRLAVPPEIALITLRRAN
ncbi:MAG: metallophosphoesterase [Polyangiaceae bacterium]